MQTDAETNAPKRGNKQRRPNRQRLTSNKQPGQNPSDTVRTAKNRAAVLPPGPMRAGEGMPGGGVTYPTVPVCVPVSTAEVAWASQGVSARHPPRSLRGTLPQSLVPAREGSAAAAALNPPGQGAPTPEIGAPTPTRRGRS